MKTEYYNPNMVSAQAERIGMRFIGILTMALIFTITGIGKYSVCHAQGNFHQFTE